MKKTTNKQYAQALYGAVVNLKGKELKQAIERFVNILVKNHKLKQAENIIKEFIKYAKQQAGIIEIEVSLARKLDKALLERIKKIFGKKVEAVEEVDEALLGGIKIKMEDKILDGSLKSQLQRLKQSMS